MISRDEVFASHNSRKIWQKFCGFFELDLKEFMDIQQELMLEQIELVADSPLGRLKFNGKKPRSIEEYRQTVPLSDYWSGYAEYIGQEGKEEWLAEKPVVWAHTSGRGGQFKWIPWTRRALEHYADVTMAIMILACAERRGEVLVWEGSRFLFILAPPPYISGISAQALADRFNIKVIPPPEISWTLSFQDRIALGFRMALSQGVDFAGAVSTALLKVGESLAARSGGLRFSAGMLKPAVLGRMLRAYLISRREGRAMLPRDIWPVKGLACGGTDTRIYRDQIKHYWGKYPHESYGMTETGVITIQSWTKKDMTFYPYLAFLEFIPEEEWLKNREDPTYQPRTILLDEVKVGETYEVVISNFYGMPLMRYRPGDMVTITAPGDDEIGCGIPQAQFYSRADWLIDLYSIVRLDELTLWQAIDSTGVPLEEWSARKEYDGATPVLRLYVEPKDEANTRDMAELVHQKLYEISPLYREAIEEMETNPVRVVTLKPGSFQRYYDRRLSEGADLAHLKPPHINASDAVINDLIRSQGGPE